jgi:predicted metal-dependent peptidase
MYTDAKVHKVEEFDPEEAEVQFHPVGGGGTSFIPVFEEIEKRDIKPALLIYFTDLLGRFPEVAPNYPVLWVSTNENAVAPFGETTYLLDGGHKGGR